jgi:peroxiredoxin
MNYNYDTFSFVLKEPELQRWCKDGVQLGSEAPDFELATIDGRTVATRDHRGRPLVLEFGSYTCPIFCGHLPTMESVAREFPEATFLVVYIREAHPGEATREHRTLDDKIGAARRLLQDEVITRTVLIDDVEGTVHRAYGGAWDPVFVIGADGRIVFRRAWNSPDEVAECLRALREGRDVPPSGSMEMAPPTGRPAGQGLLRGGKKALLDFYDSARPPVREGLERSPATEVRDLITKRRERSG